MLKAAVKLRGINAEIRAFVCPAKEFDDYTAKVFGQRVLADSYKDKPPLAAEFQMKAPDRDMNLLWFPTTERLDTALVHECVHAVAEILTTRNIPVVGSDGNSETLAYLLQYVCTSLADQLLLQVQAQKAKAKEKAADGKAPSKTSNKPKEGKK